MLASLPKSSVPKDGILRESLSQQLENRTYGRLFAPDSALSGVPSNTAANVASQAGATAMEKQLQPYAHIPQERHDANTLPTATGPCSPRSPKTKQRPALLQLHSSFGCTASASADLGRRECDAHREASPTTVTILIDQRKPLPPTPTTPFTIMGNSSSRLAAKPDCDATSSRSVVRHDSKQPVSQRSVQTLFKRVDSRSPLPDDATADVTTVLHRDGLNNEDSYTTDDDDDMVPRHTNHPGNQPDRCGPSYSSMPPAVHSASTVTMVDHRADRPPNAANHLRDYRPSGQSPARESQLDGFEEYENVAPLLPGDDEASFPLSPTIPAPSPLPEDSPHKYGLRDKMNTPEVPDNATEEINIAKMRRKSSGLEIFNEAKTLQSAQSFLNGLSAARRRAESAAAVGTTDNSGSATMVSMNGSRPASTVPASARPRADHQDGEGRREGYNFKSSGFAYSRPLTLAQIKCYRGHDRLLPSRNKHAPVECAVCHIDDDADHFSCSWCALRMCRLCRGDFAKRGPSALRERTRKAELGGAGDSANSSSRESLSELRKTAIIDYT